MGSSHAERDPPTSNTPDNQQHALGIRLCYRRNRTWPAISPGQQGRRTRGSRDQGRTRDRRKTERASGPGHRRFPDDLTTCAAHNIPQTSRPLLHPSSSFGDRSVCGYITFHNPKSFSLPHFACPLNRRPTAQCPTAWIRLSQTRRRAQSLLSLPRLPTFPCSSTHPPWRRKERGTEEGGKTSSGEGGPSTVKQIFLLRGAKETVLSPCLALP